MPYSHTNLPPDARKLPDFDVIRGLDTTAKRVEFDVNTLNATPGVTGTWHVGVGEPVRTVAGLTPTADTDAFNIDTPAAATNGEMIGVSTGARELDAPLGIAFDKFAANKSTYYGFPSANGRGKLTVLKQVFMARYKVADWFVTAKTQITTNDTNYPLGLPLDTGADDEPQKFMLAAITQECGASVVIVKTVQGTAKFMTLPMDYNILTGGVASSANHMLQKQVVGKITKKYTVEGEEFVNILFKF